MKKVVITVLKGPKIINICAEGSMMEVLMRIFSPMYGMKAVRTTALSCYAVTLL
ncbi:hypothetical protein SCLCIDRAFT_1209860 [Scleroderma citrinum Foug A]|uniref:Uncharacterized protein n=1 Tax=Scleroderma citrinum Foug A TaxID=1036808 RepID=A0A0C3A250_9AGAM|nr:hypothetical protein SCLCIDRAFT_1209860 [Scleroderma citrinum Foug A]